MGTMADRVATRYRVVLAFSYSEALSLLGFPASARPSDDDVRRVYRGKVRDIMRDNPGAGISQEAIKDLNRAKDTLTGQFTPKADPDDPNDMRGRPPKPGDSGTGDVDFSDFDGGPVKKKPDVTVSFEEAKADADIPANVKWMFVTDAQRGAGNYSSDEFTNSAMGWVACGETDSHWVFVNVEHYYYQAHTPGVTDGKTDVWDIQTTQFPKTPPTAAELYSHVKKVWRNFAHELKQFNSKVVDATGWHFHEKRPTGREITIKQLVSNLTGAEFTGKLKVEIGYKRAPFGETPAGYYKSQYGNAYLFELVINGKEYTLEAADVATLGQLRIGGKAFIERVFGDYPEHSRPKNLTLNRDGQAIMEWMAERLGHLPEWVRASLTRAAGQKGKKTAEDRSYP